MAGACWSDALARCRLVAPHGFVFVIFGGAGFVGRALLHQLRNGRDTGDRRGPQCPETERAERTV